MEATKGKKSSAKSSAKGSGKNQKRKGIIALVVIIALIVFFSLINFITDLLWFQELGYISVFLTKLFTQLKIGIPVFLIVTIGAYIYFKLLKRNYYRVVVSDDVDRGKAVNISTWILSIVFALIVTGMSVSRLWFTSLKAINSSDFGFKEALFNYDASFYVMKLDFITTLVNMIIGLMVFLLIITLIYYVVLVSLHKPQMYKDKNATGADFGDRDRFDDGYQQKSHNPFDGFGLGSFFDEFTGADPNAAQRRTYRPGNDVSPTFDKTNMKRFLTIGKRQLIVVSVVFFVAVAAHFFLKQYDLLYDHTGVVYGAGFTDVTIRLWMYRILCGLSIAGAVAAVYSIQKRKWKPIVKLIVIMIVAGIIGAIVGAVVQNLVVAPDEINKESKYLERNIKSTQYAYNLADVTIKPFKATNDLTPRDIKNNDPTISNIRINDYKPTKTFYNQTQAIRQYYDFNDVDVDRYKVNGKYTQTFLASREMNEENISSTWLNQHIKYTHGYGVTMSQVNNITASGQPDMLVGDIPPVSEAKEIKVARPEIYFGESTNNYLLVQTNENEFDYPDGDKNKYCKYEGSAGIRLNPMKRFLFAVREKSLKLLVSTNVKNSSRIIINRNIEKRLNEIMPYLSYESDPYMCEAGGKLYWIVDAYTTSSRFPYSEPYSQESTTNYIRNSVKVVIDAYNGTVDYYIVDETDAIAQTMQKIFPKLFKDFDDIPKEIKAHIRYPNQMFDIQAKVYQRYHMNDVNVFYQNEDYWDISNEIYGTKEQEMEPNYYILNLPGEKKEEFVNSIPFTPKGKKNMTGLMMARNDGEHYGKLVLYKLPKNRVIYGPMQIEAQIDQNTEISKEFSLWSQAGTNYSRGNMFVIPIEDSILYVEPVYLEAKNSSIPEVKRVILAYGDKIAYEPTLAAALDSLFGDGSGEQYETDADSAKSGKDKEKKDEPLSQQELIKKAQAAMDNAEKAQKEGNWSEYGKQLELLKKYLGELSK